MDKIQKTIHLMPESYNKLLYLTTMKQTSVKNMIEKILTAGINHRYSLFKEDLKKNIDPKIVEELTKRDKRRRY